MKSVAGIYGAWLVKNISCDTIPSLKHPERNSLKNWKVNAINKVKEIISVPNIQSSKLEVKVKAVHEHDGLKIEQLQWQLPYGYPTEAILLKPSGQIADLPGVLALHDHSGNYYFGKRKIARISRNLHPIIVDHKNNYYSGKSWANELAKKGYVVLVHDVIGFGSRRVRVKDVTDIGWNIDDIENNRELKPELGNDIKTYNEWSIEYEHTMSKALMCGGTTWPGVILAEDQIALSVLSSRSEVDKQNLGCCGLSGGGFRANYLAGLDHRIKCVVSIGAMTTWEDFIMNKCRMHTWMAFASHLSKHLEFPQILGLRVPLPTMVLNNAEDTLFSLDHMRKADRVLSEIFAKFEAEDMYKGKFYSGKHKFDSEMQKDAFSWFDQWLKYNGPINIPL